MELIITEDSENEQECIYIDTRFDLIPDHFMYSALDTVVLMNFLSKYGDILKRTYATEISWKNKKPHCHIRFELLPNGVKFPKALSQTFKYYITKNHPTMKLAKGKYFIKRDIPNSLKTFFQYCYKDIEEFEDIEQDLQQGFSETEQRDLWISAREAKRLAVERFEKDQEKKENEITEYNRLHQFLDANVCPVKVQEYRDEVAKRHGDEIYTFNHNYQLISYKVLQRHIGTIIVKYYMEYHDGKVPFPNKIVSIFNRFCLKSQILFPEDLAEIIFKV